MDGIISLPIALAGYFFIPDVPETSRAFYLNEDVGGPQRYKKPSIEADVRTLGTSIFQEENAARRSQASSPVYQGEDLEDTDILAYLRSYGALCVSKKFLSHLESCHGMARTKPNTHSFFNNGGSSAAPVFAQFLKSSKHPKYSIAQINDYPTTTYAVQVVTTLVYAWTSDSVLKGDRLPPIVFGGVCNPAISSLQVVNQRLTLTSRWSILSATSPSLSGIFQKDGDGHAILFPVQALGYLVSAWRMRPPNLPVLMLTAYSGGPTRSAPTTTKNEPLS